MIKLLLSHVQWCVKLVWQFGDLDLEAFLDFEQNLFVWLFIPFVFAFVDILIWLHEVNGQTLCSESSCSSDSVKVSVSVLREVYFNS